MSGLIPEAVIAEVRESNDIVAVVSEYVDLRRAGKHWRGRCPFHQERTPSFNVNAEEQFYYCFGCGAGGNVINFVMAMENLPFVEAVERLAERVGIMVTRAPSSPQEKRQRSEQAKLLQVHEVAQDFFVRNLMGNQGGAARHYLASRGVQEKTRQLFGLGYALQEWQGLINHLGHRGFTTEECLAAGLALEGQRNRPYDRFRGRLMFPVCDWRGRVIGFGGRVLDGGQPKYLNSPETLLFSKGNNLYGLNLARVAFRKQGCAIIVEGFMDVIGLYEAGFSNAVASLGTALTDSQARLLQRFTDEVVIAFDGDAAGEAATWRGLEILRNRGLKVRVVELPGGEDPDTFVRTYGSQAFEELVQGAVGLTEFKLGTIIRRGDFSTVDGKVETTGRIVEILAEIDSPMEQNEYLRWAAVRLKVSEDVLAAELEAYEEKAGIQSSSRHRISTKSNNREDRGILAKDSPEGGSSLKKAAASWSGLSAIESNLLRLLLCEGYLVGKVSGVLVPEDFVHPVAQKTMECLYACQRAGQLDSGGAVFDFVEDDSVRELITDLLASKASLPLPEACMHYVRRLQIMQLREGLRRLEDQVERVEHRTAEEDLGVQLDNLLIRYRQVREEITREFSKSH